MLGCSNKTRTCQEAGTIPPVAERKVDESIKTTKGPSWMALHIAVTVAPRQRLPPLSGVVEHPEMMDAWPVVATGLYPFDGVVLLRSIPLPAPGAYSQDLEPTSYG